MKIKEPLSIYDQLQRLTERGLIVENAQDETELITWLNNVGYYRLSGYWWVYENKYPEQSPRDHVFKPGTTWKHIKHTYVFDQKFRRHMFTAIEKIEVAIKALWAQHLAIKYNTSHPHEHQNLFNNEIYSNQKYKKCTYNILVSNYESSKEPFAVHYRNKYPEYKTPPIWVITLLLTLGDFTNWLKCLKNRSDKKAILAPFPFSPQEMISILTHLRWVRNVCAHNGRLWNKRTPFVFEFPKGHEKRLIHSRTNKQKLDSKIYNTILVMSDILRVIDPTYPFTHFIKDMITKNHYIDPVQMGFPQNWTELEEWKFPTPEHKYNKKKQRNNVLKPAINTTVSFLFIDRLHRHD